MLKFIYFGNRFFLVIIAFLGINYYSVQSIPQIQTVISTNPTNTLYTNVEFITELKVDEMFQMNQDITKYIPSVIVFYAVDGFSDYSRKYVPIYTNLAKEFTELYNSTIQFGSFNCFSCMKVCNENRVNAFPAIKLFNFPSGN